MAVTAEELFKEFKHVPLSEFFRKNKQYLGYVGKIKSLTTVIHELLTNSLDACEESSILPDIKIEIKEIGDGHYRVITEDNGPGIPASHLKMVFGQLLAGTKFHRNIQLRGQQGLGVSGCVLFSQITTGRATKVKSGTGTGKVLKAKVKIDIKSNAPEILEQVEEFDNWRGTRVESEFKGVQYSKGEKGPFEYIRRTAAANPHAQIYFKDPEGGEILFERVIDKIPKTPKEQKPHPEGLETHDILDIVNKTKSRNLGSMLTKELSRVSSSKVKEIESMINEGRMQEGKLLLDMRISPKRLKWDDAEDLMKAFQRVKFMAPPGGGLIPIGSDQVKKALSNIITPEFIGSISRSPSVFKGGIPFLVEVAVAYGGNAGRVTVEGGRKYELMRFANRAPLLFDSGSCAISKAVNSIDWKRYNIHDYENSPLTLFVNLVSTHVPYTSTGKQSVASEEEVVAEIRFAIMQIARSLQTFLSGRKRAAEREAKKKMFERYVPETAKAISKITGKDAQALQEKLSNIVFDKFGEEMGEEAVSGEEPPAAYEENIPEPVEEEEMEGEAEENE
jgi:DNA topoisomerase-6 subunit B